MKVLVLTSEPVSAQQLRDALHRAADSNGIEVMVVAPALHDGPIKFWLSDADDAIAKADAVRRRTVAELGAEGVPAFGDTGESDPLDAIADALRTFDPERIVLFTHPSEQQHYCEDIDVHEIGRRSGLPVDHALVSA
jgi:GABA permease